jgi:hypothetical protein
MEKVMCECGESIYEYNYTRHLQSKKHINFLNDPLQVRIIIPKKERKITCECGSKYVFRNDVRKLAHEGSYLHWKNLNILNKGYKLDI